MYREGIKGFARLIFFIGNVFLLAFRVVGFDTFAKNGSIKF